MSADRPNVVLVTTDQQRMDTIHALGASHMDTPNIDRLVDEGVTFTDCHVTAPLCVPSRASLFTGYYPHTTGIYSNESFWQHTWVERLQDDGYYTVNVGKMHTIPYDAPAGFDERYPVENKDRYLASVPKLPSERFYFDEWDRALAARGFVKQQREFYRQWEDYEERLGAHEWELPEDTHPDMFVGDMATWWLDTMPKLDRPLFLEVGFPGPHPPFDPVERYAEAYLDREIPMPEVDEADVESQPPPLRAKREFYAEVDSDSIGYPLDPDEEHVRRMRAYYYANVAMIDEKVGQLMDALEANGYGQDTIVIFASDHGEGLGDHGHIEKLAMYDEVTRVPAIVWAPDGFEGIEGGRTVDGLCQLMDLGPTILELAGVDVPASMEAESLLPAVRGEEWNGREYVFTEQPLDIGFMDDDMGAGFMTMVRSDDWKLVHFLGESYGQLFDLEADPEERENRWDDPDAAEAKHGLLATLREWRVESSYRTRDWVEDLLGEAR
jgi:arylsulfatase A-like enzyme